MLKRDRFIAIAAAVSLLSVPVAAGRPSRAAEGSGDVIKFGASLALTGSLASEGRLVKDGYDWLVKTINDRGGLEVGGKKYHVVNSSASRCVDLLVHRK
jgi:branched-chain amino acid transport system substrate-binding protein